MWPRPPRTPLGRAVRSLAALPLAGVLVVGVGASPEHCPAVETADLQRAAEAAVGWFTANQNADGTWLYSYATGDADAEPGYNAVRHNGAVMGLYQAAAAGIPGAAESADRGLGWVFDRVVSRGPGSAQADGDRAPTGATALLVAGLVQRRAVTSDHGYDGRLLRLGQFLVAQVEPSGAVLADYDLDAGKPVAHEYSKYYTGETYWALAHLGQAFPDGPWMDAARRVGHYLATERDDAEGYWPPIPDHWAADGLGEIAEAGVELGDDEIAYARSQAELFGMQVRWVSQRFGPWGRFVRGEFVPRGGGYGVLGEGLTAFWRAARADSRLSDVDPAIGARATCIAALAIEAQSTSGGPKVEGAWFRDGVTRMDDQQHALAALLRTEAIVRAQGVPAMSGTGDHDVSPPLWLAVLAIVAALNPPRARFAVPHSAAGDDDGRVAPPALAGTGGLVVLVAVIALAGLSRPFLDALHASRPQFRLAAGGLAVLAGLLDLVCRPPRPQPALPAWRASLVPVTVPALLRPALVVLAVATGADLAWPSSASPCTPPWDRSPCSPTPPHVGRAGRRPPWPPCSSRPASCLSSTGSTLCDGRALDAPGGVHGGAFTPGLRGRCGKRPRPGFSPEAGRGVTTWKGNDPRALSPRREAILGRSAETLAVTRAQLMKNATR